MNKPDLKSMREYWDRKHPGERNYHLEEMEALETKKNES